MAHVLLRKPKVKTIFYAPKDVKDFIVRESKRYRLSQSEIIVRMLRNNANFLRSQEETTHHGRL